MTDEPDYQKLVLDALEGTRDIGRDYETLSGITGLSGKQLLDILDRMIASELIERVPEIPLWYRRPDKDAMQKIIPFDPYNFDVIKICGEILKDRPVYFDRTGVFWRWNQVLKCWQMQDDTDILNEMYSALVYGGLINKRDALLAAMKMVSRKNQPKEKPKIWVQFSDIVVDVETGELIKPTSEYFFVNPLPWKLGEKEETPMIDALFEQWVGAEYKIMLYEIVAYCMLEDYPIHRLFGFIGSGRNGKGTFLRLIHRFIGSNNTASTSLDKLKDSRFEAAKLYKKTVAFVGETNFTEIRESALLKSLTGQDLIGGEFKNKAPFDFFNYAKLLIATNSLPITHDKTVGFYSRWILVNFPNTYNNGKDVLLEIPDWEYENLGKKCVRILKELLERGEFSKEKNIEEKAKEYEETSNPLVTFLRKRCQKDPYGSIPLWEFYDEFQAYLGQHGYRIQSKKEVSSLLRQMGYDVQRRTVTKDGEQKTYFMIGNLSFIQEKITESTEITVVPLYTHIGGIEYKQGNLSNLGNFSCPRCEFTEYNKGINCPKCNYFEEK